MSRSGYQNDLDTWQMIKWRGMVASAIRGKRGQSMLRDLLAALDAMSEKELIVNELVSEEGQVCALGALGVARGVDMSKLDPDEPEQIAASFNVAPCLAQEIVYMNDEYLGRIWDSSTCNMRAVTPEMRWKEMRRWVVSNIHTSPSETV